MPKQTIHVNQNHIINGKPCTREYCPIALAMKWAGFEDVKVGKRTIIFKNLNTDDNDYYDIIMPENAKRAAAKFDKTGKIKPFSFQIRY